MVAVIVEKPHVLKLAEEVPSAPGEGEVAVRVERAGICGSDQHILHGANPFAVYPRVIGHEMAGLIEAIGPGVTGLAVGQRVVVDPIVACGKCFCCRKGRPNVCARLKVFGVHLDGFFQNRMVVPAANAVVVPAGIPADLAALAEPLSVAANVLLRTGCDADDVVLVYGAGTAGLTVVQVARLHGARCIVVDPDTARLARAEAFGAAAVIDPARTDVAAAVAGELDGLGPSVVIDAAGVPALLAEACRVAAPGGRIGLLGFSTEPSPVVQKDIVGKELTLVGSRLNRRLLAQVVGWLAEGRLRPAAMITQTFPARDVAAAFDLVDRHPQQTIKVQLDFS
jgi:L-gulonate 5-dehydrogenase